jgi:hypothetical protein
LLGHDRDHALAIDSVGRSRAEQSARACRDDRCTLLVPDKDSRASAGAHARCAGNPDRPARRQAHSIGSIAEGVVRFETSRLVRGSRQRDPVSFPERALPTVSKMRVRA